MTRLHGTLTVRGPATDSLQDVWLEIVEDGTVVRADLARAAVSPARAALLGIRSFILMRFALMRSRHPDHLSRFNIHRDTPDLPAAARLSCWPEIKP